MTDQTTELTAADETAAEGTQAPDETAETETPERGDREAAKYRRRLRETETERDELRTQVETYQRAAVEALTDLQKPDAIWTAGVRLEDVLTDGQPDAVKVREAVVTAADQLGLARRPRNVSRHEGGTTGQPNGGRRFEDALRTPGDR